MAGYTDSIQAVPSDVIEYGETLGLFDSIRINPPRGFHLIFEIARTVLTDRQSEAYRAVKDLLEEETETGSERDENIEVNRMDRTSPLSDRMEIETYRTINDLKKALPRELAQDDDIFNAKLFTRTLLVEHFYESERDTFKSISTRDDGRQANSFDQKVYILLDCSRSMDFKNRSFYSKCLVAEFMRQKIRSRAKIYFRTFQSKTGPLFKALSHEDYPAIMGHVLSSPTGGSGTDIQKAVFQAVDDMDYDREMLNSEILVVTDGGSRIDRQSLKTKLGAVKLNILKIGDEKARLDYYELKSVFEKSGIKYDPSSFISNGSVNRARSSEPMEERRAQRILSDYSDSVFRDLRDISSRYIEIADIDSESLSGSMSDEETIAMLNATESRLRNAFITSQPDELLGLYRQVVFFQQYLDSMRQNGSSIGHGLQQLLERASELKKKMLQNPGLLREVLETDGMGDDRAELKQSMKELKKMLKEQALNGSRLTGKQMRDGRLVFMMQQGPGKGRPGELLRLLFVKLQDALAAMLAGAGLRRKKR